MTDVMNVSYEEMLKVHRARIEEIKEEKAEDMKVYQEYLEQATNTRLYADKSGNVPLMEQYAEQSEAQLEKAKEELETSLYILNYELQEITEAIQEIMNEVPKEKLSRQKWRRSEFRLPEIQRQMKRYKEQMEQKIEGAK